MIDKKTTCDIVQHTQVNYIKCKALSFLNRISDYSRVPDPEWHKRISLVKSCLRISAGFSLIFLSFWASGVLLIFAELLGVLEEFV